MYKDDNQKKYAKTADWKKVLKAGSKNSFEEQSDEEESDISINAKMRTMILNEKNKGTILYDTNTKRMSNMRKSLQLTQMKREANQFIEQQKQKAKIDQINKGLFILTKALCLISKNKFVYHILLKKNITKAVNQLYRFILKKYNEELLEDLKYRIRNKHNKHKSTEKSGQFVELEGIMDKEKDDKDNEKKNEKENDDYNNKKKVLKMITFSTRKSEDNEKVMFGDEDTSPPKSYYNSSKIISKPTNSQSNNDQNNFLLIDKNKGDILKLQLLKDKKRKISNNELNLNHIISPKQPMIPQSKCRQSLKLIDTQENQFSNQHDINIISPNTIQIFKNTQQEKIEKVEDKQNRLKDKLQKQKDHFDQLEKQLLLKSIKINELTNQIAIQSTKVNCLNKGEDLSISESLISSSIDYSKQYNQGLRIIISIITLHLHKQFTDLFFRSINKRKRPVKKMTHRLDHILGSKLREQSKKLFPNENNNINNEDYDYPIIFPSRKMKKKVTNKYNNKMIIDVSEIHSDHHHKNIITDNEKEVFPGFTQKKKMNRASFGDSNNLQLDEDHQILRKITFDLDQVYKNNRFAQIDNDDNNNDSDEDDQELLEYDKFYKEDFFREEMFKYDEKEAKDREEEEIKKEAMRTQMKKQIKDLEHIKGVNTYKGLDCAGIENDIKNLKNDYAKSKKDNIETVDLQMNNTDALLYKGRLLYNYFNGEKYTSGLPKFSIDSEKNIKGKEIIQFRQVGKEESARRYFDRCPFLHFRKRLHKGISYTKFYCNLLCDNKWFEHFSLLIILINTIIILASEPTDPNNLANTTDNYFLYYYTIEAILKIFAFGFICTEFAYLKDYWNILDFIVIFVGWISLILENAMQGQKISGLAGLRGFRILRPLKTVKSIKGLKNLVIALIASVLKLADTSIVLFFFFLIFAIGGVQMWSGLFMRRCMSVNLGYMVDFTSIQSMCTFDSDCVGYNEPGNKFICVQSFLNPNNGVLNFDNTLIGFVTIFVVSTMEGWTNVFLYVSRTFQDKYYINPIIIFLYFHILLFVGGYYLINLFLAVTNSEFTKVETERKEAMSKKSFYLLIKSKYDLKEKEKQEKKKKEQELKMKNQDKDGESLRELQYRIKEEAFHIRKNINDIPINYDTVKDLYIIQNDNPEELAKIEELIDEEERYLCKDIDNQCSHLDKIIKQNKEEKKLAQKQFERKKSSILLDNDNKPINPNDPSFRNSIKFQKRKPTTLLVRPVTKMFPPAIDLCISYTQQWVKDEIVTIRKFEVKQSNTVDVLKQKIEKKEMEKYYMNQVSIKEDLSFEKEKKIAKEKELEQMNKTSNHMPQKSSRITSFGGNPQLVSKQVINALAKKKTLITIGDELSFMTDLSLNDSNELEEEDQSIEGIDETQIMALDKDICIRKKILMQNDLCHDIHFNIPEPIIPAILKMNNDNIVKEKIELMRQKFNLHDFIAQSTNDGFNVHKLGRRNSFLNFMQFPFDQTPKNLLYNIPISTDKNIDGQKQLDISLYNKDDDLSIGSKSFSDFDILPFEIPEKNTVVDENVDLEEIKTKMENNQVAAIARKSIVDRNGKFNSDNFLTQKLEHFYSNVNEKMTMNIKIDTREPRGRGNKITNRSHIYEYNFNDEDDQDNNTSVFNTNKKTITIKSQETIVDKKKKIHLYKSTSVKKNLWKYPQADTKQLIVEEKNMKKEFINLTQDQEAIPLNLRTRKYYMNYLNNIKDKDLKVKDDFKVDIWKNEVLGPEKKIIVAKELPQSKEAVFVFNNKALNLKKYKYIRNKKFEYLDHEYAILTHRLTNLPINILELMHPRTMDFGKFSAGKDIQIGTLNTSRSIIKNSKSTMKIGQSVMSSNSQSSKSKSVLSQFSSVFGNPHRLLDNLKYKKNFYEKVFKRIDGFNYKTLSHYLIEEDTLFHKLTDDKRREEKEKELEEQSRLKDNVIEVKTEINAIKVFDIRTNSRRYISWSGQDVMYKRTPEAYLNEWNLLINQLENFNVIIWNTEGSMKIVQKIRYGLYLISINPWIDYWIMCVVIANAIIMGMDGNLFTQDAYNTISISNYAFNSIFIAEFIIKFFGLGPIVYFSDAFTYLDLVIIAFAILDMAAPDTSTSDTIGGSKKLTSQLSFLRVFRIFRVLRLTKVLRKMKSMRLIIVSIKKSLSNVAYIVLILIMFILIFQLLGMSILSSNTMYQSFLSAFYVTFQVLTIENWDGILYQMFPLSPFVFFYYLVWILIGNYILFNLFISILLQSFEGDDYDEDDEDEDDFIEKQFALPDYFTQLKKLEKEHMNRIKEAKGKKSHNKNPINNRKPSTSNNTSRISGGGGGNSMNVSASSLNNYSSSTVMKDETQTMTDDDDHETDVRGLTGVDKTMYQWKQINKLYIRNDCEYSLYIFKQQNIFRLGCMKLQSYKRFDTFILLMILLSTSRLILDTFISGYTSVFVFDMMDVFFNFVFLFEMIVKIIALGFVLDEGTYLRDNWNKIDLVIVIVSLIDFQSLVSKYSANSQGNSSLNFLKVLRLLRTLRPLRFISHNVQLKLIITSLFDSIIPICNALFIVLIVFFMFSIVGINLFYNLYHNCYIEGTVVPFVLADSQFSTNLANVTLNNTMTLAENIQQFCSDKYNGILDVGPNFKFTNIFISLMTSYVLGNMEGWPDIMNSYRIYSDYYGLFFVIYLLVVSYFFLNLFTGIMFKYFNMAWSKERSIGDDDKNANKYFDFLKQIPFIEPDFRAYAIPEVDSCQYKLFLFVNSKIFDNFIMIIIMFNLITMAINFEQSSSDYSTILDYINLSFTSIFILECLIKLLALGPLTYFHFGWNKFDFFVVCASIVDIIFMNIQTIDASFLKSFQIIRVLRVLRVTRVLRLVKSLKSLEKLLQTLKWSVTALFNVFILMFLIFCIFAILGCYLYDGITYELYHDKMTLLNQYYNFDNFYYAFLLVFRCATGEAWPMIMLELAYIDETQVSANQAFIFMIVMNFISAVIMLNLFLMVTLQQYDEFTNKSYNPVEKFEDFSNNFKLAWNKFSSTKDKGYRIKKILVPNFFLEFTWRKLQFPEINKIEHIKKYITDLKLRNDNENYVYFHDVLFKIIIKQMGYKIDRTLPENGVLLKEEKSIGESIKRKINRYMHVHEINKNKLNNPLSTFNPLTSHLYFKISYMYVKTFLNYYKENGECFMYDDWNNGDDIESITDKESDMGNPLSSARRLKSFVGDDISKDFKENDIQIEGNNLEDYLLTNKKNHKAFKSSINSDFSNQKLNISNPKKKETDQLLPT